MSCFYCLVWVNVLDRLCLGGNPLTRRLKCVCWCLCCVSSSHVQSQLHSVQLLLHRVHHPQRAWKLCLRVLSTEGRKKNSICGKMIFFNFWSRWHGNQPLIKWLKCNFVCLGWTFFWSFMVFEDYSLLFQVKILKFPVLVLCVSMEVCIFSVETVYRYTEPSSRQVCGANKPLYRDPYSLHQVSVPLCVIIHGDV